MDGCFGLFLALKGESEMQLDLTILYEQNAFIAIQFTLQRIDLRCTCLNYAFIFDAYVG